MLNRQQNIPTMSTGTGRVPPDGTSSLHGGTPPQVPPNLQVEPTSYDLTFSLTRYLRENYTLKPRVVVL
ncbi:hypothetical protein RRG08_017640 [Elysia crispata]|uniref:Uncharacterized protein n=1 Tax=Elysia crispata TaxID=231223 RepID=A0AAE1DE93_9GAST|nr:hypothetical protein RRG08_017640 [Elysia crispata]